MTVTLDRPTLPSPPSLPEALGIPGARSVSLFDPNGPTVLWWAGVDEPARRQAAAVVALAAAAIVLAGPADELGDVILTSAATFHVIRLAGDGTSHVAHLTLSRTGANLAMARHDFRLVVADYAARPRHAADPPPPAPAQPHPVQPASVEPEPVRPEPTQPEPAEYETAKSKPDLPKPAKSQPNQPDPAKSGPIQPSPAQRRSTQPVLVRPVPPGPPGEPLGELPRRERSEPPSTAAEVTDLPADWFTSLIQAPFANDEGILDRILVTLRTL